MELVQTQRTWNGIVMRVLFVASFNKGRFAAFITEQAEALKKNSIEVDLFGIVGKGIKGYMKCLPLLKKRIQEFKPDVLHAHFGLSGLLANLQRTVPVVTTFHGSDINVPSLLRLSKICMLLSKHNIFVSLRNIELANPHNKYSLLPCGVDLEVIKPVDRAEARQSLGWGANDKKVLFAGAFDNAVKNPELAMESVKLTATPCDLIELKGYSRPEINLLFSAADVFLLTSHTEGSPQVIKEALACGCPIVSVDVGDVAERTANIAGCTITSRNPQEIANALDTYLANPLRTNGRERIIELGLDNDTVAKKLIAIYNNVFKK